MSESRLYDFYQVWRKWIDTEDWDSITMPVGRPELVVVAVSKLVCVDPFTDAVAAAIERVDPQPLMSRMCQLLRYDASLSCLRWYVKRLPLIVPNVKDDDLPFIDESMPFLFHVLYYDRTTTLDLLDLLFAHGVDPNDQDIGGMTAVIWWVILYVGQWREGRLLGERRLAVVRRLLEAGCDPLLEDRQGRTVFDYVAFVENEAKRLGTWTEVSAESRELMALLRAWA
jgi:hypothetical protein